jgi:hypothetical protein
LSKPETTEKEKRESEYAAGIGGLSARALYLILLVSIAIPVAIPLGLPLPVTAPVKAFYDAVEKVPAGGKIVLDVQVAVGTYAEEGPLFRAVIEHVSRRAASSQIKYVIIVNIAESQSLSLDIMAKMTLNGNKYGVDYAFMGIVSATEPAISAWAKDIYQNTPVDVYGTPVGQLPVMKDIRTLKDFNLAIVMQGSLIEFWMRQWNVPYNMPMAVTCGISSSIAGWRVYYETGQFVGFLPGIRGAGEYEIITKSPGRATISNDAMSVSHLLTVLAVVGANIAYFKKGGKK